MLSGKVSQEQLKVKMKKKKISQKSRRHFREARDLYYRFRSVEDMLEAEIDDENKKAIELHKKNKGKIESVFGSALEWGRCDNLKKSFITKRITKGGYRSERETWSDIHEQMIEAMIKFEKAFSPYISKLKVK